MLTAQRWHPRAAEARYGFHIDANDSKVHVEMESTDTDVAAALRPVLGDRVVIGFGAPSREAGSRGNDVSAHYGGAGIPSPMGAGIKVVHLQGSFCDGGCTGGLMKAQKTGYTISAKGGLRWPRLRPADRHVGDHQGHAHRGTPGIIHAEKILEVQSHLGVEVLTAP